MGVQLCPMKYGGVILAACEVGPGLNEEGGSMEVAELLVEGAQCTQRECAWWIKKRGLGKGNCCAIKLMGVGVILPLPGDNAVESQ